MMKKLIFFMNIDVDVDVNVERELSNYVKY